MTLTALNVSFPSRHLFSYAGQKISIVRFYERLFVFWENIVTSHAIFININLCYIINSTIHFTTYFTYFCMPQTSDEMFNNYNNNNVDNDEARLQQQQQEALYVMSEAAQVKTLLIRVFNR